MYTIAKAASSSSSSLEKFFFLCIVYIYACMMMMMSVVYKYTHFLNPLLFKSPIYALCCVCFSFYYIFLLLLFLLASMTSWCFIFFIHFFFLLDYSSTSKLFLFFNVRELLSSRFYFNSFFSGLIAGLKLYSESENE